MYTRAIATTRELETVIFFLKKTMKTQTGDVSCCCFGLAVLLLGLSVLTSYSVRGVGCSRPEPWSRLHCSEWLWCEPVALSDSLERPWAAKPAHMDREFLSRISGFQLAHLSEEWSFSGFQADPLLWGDPMAQLVWCWSCQRWQTAGGGSNPCWSTRESQVRSAERQRSPTQKKGWPFAMECQPS